MRSDLKIHVIDDDSLIRNSIYFLLEAEGYTVRAYVSAQSFLDMTEPAGNGCIITDIHMPEMNGLDLLATLNERGVFLPAIAMSGRSNLELKIEAMKRGAVDFLEKPFAPEILLESVRTAIKNSSPYRAAEAAWKAAQDAYEAQAAATAAWKSALAAYAEAQAAAVAIDHAATLRAGCECRIELAERADMLRAELAKIEAQAAMREANVNAHLPVGLPSIGLGSAAEERARWVDIRARWAGIRERLAVSREASRSEMH